MNEKCANALCVFDNILRKRQKIEKTLADMGNIIRDRRETTSDRKTNTGTFFMVILLGGADCNRKERRYTLRTETAEETFAFSS
jgi:hypothetical protein